MYSFLKRIILLFSLFLYGCSELSSSRGENVSEFIEDMVLLQAAGDSAWLQPEKDDSTKKPTWIQFTYDYRLAKTEVTIGEFVALMGYYPVNAMESLDQTIAVGHVSWFDAILFANKKSKLLGLDTVYSYVAVSKAPSGSVYEMQGLRSDFTKDGFRLPTEAEWVYAARAGSQESYAWGNSIEKATKYAWYAENAEGSAKPICQFEELGGFCDLSGNMMEWVQDWFGEFPEGTVPNFAGPVNGNAELERVVKGGSFVHPWEFLQISSRRDVYSVSSSTKREYIGFRLARGAIPEPQFSAGGNISSKSVIDQISPRSEVLKYLKAARAKLVMLDKATGNLLGYHFDAQNTREYVWTADHPIYHPMISPDGKWIAYSTSYEGQLKAIGKDGFEEPSIYVRPFGNDTDGGYPVLIAQGSIPRWWVDSASGDTALIYVSSAMNNSNELWEQQLTTLQKMKGSTPVGAKLPLTEGAYHGGLSQDGRLLVSASPSLLVKNLVTNQVDTLFQKGGNGKSESGSEQVCNASLSPTNGQIAFIDFGYSENSSIVGRDYDVHEFLFMTPLETESFSHMSGGVSGVSGDTLLFSHPEWTTLDPFLISSMTSDDQSSVHLFNTEVDKSLELFRSENLWHPHLWAEPTPEIAGNFSLDSLGWYHYPLVDIIQYEISWKLKRFWEVKDSIGSVLLGSSRAMYGIEAEALPGGGMNMGYTAARLAGVGFFLENYILPQAENLEHVFFSLDIDFLSDGEDFIQDTISAGIGFAYDKNHNYWKDSIPRGFVESLKLAPVHDMPYEKNGDFFLESLGWGEEPPAHFENHVWNQKKVEENLKNLEHWILLAAKKQVQMTAIIFPQSPHYKEQSHYGKYGPENTQAEWVIEQLRSLEKKHSEHFRLVDFYQGGDHEFTSDEFYDEDHLSEEGLKKLTAQLLDSLS